MYKLINPHIDGSINVDFKGKTNMDAANEAWGTISNNLTNNVPKFAFSLEKTNDGSLHHFIVSEMVGGNKDVNFAIDELKLEMTPIQDQVFKKFISESAEKREAIQAGGSKKRRYKKHDDSSSDDSDSDSDSDSSSEEKQLYKNLKKMKMNSNSPKPITYWWYNPTLYQLNNLYVPTFKYPSSPYVQLNLNSAYWNV
jgi:hypothetical protein